MSQSPSSSSLIWAERPGRELLRLSIPITVSMVSHATMSLVDTACVARLGPSALAGVGLGSVAFFTFAAFGFGFFRGSKTLISNAIGAGDGVAVRLHRSASAYSAVVVGLVVTGGLALAAAWMPSATESEAAGIAAQTYASTLSFAGLPAMLYVSFRESRYGIGDSRGPMVAALVANGVNIALDITLVWVLDYGVQGAAIATLASYIVQVLILTPRRGTFVVPRREDLVALVRIGAPTGIQFVLEVGSFAILALVLATMEERQMAAHQVALQLMHFVFLPMNAVAESCAVMTGQAFGAKRIPLLRRVSKLGMKVAIVYAITWFVVLCLVRRSVAASFVDDSVLAELIAVLLLAGAVFQLVDGLGMVAGAVLRSLRDVRYAAVVGVTASWLLTPPITYGLGIMLGLGALGGWIGLSVQFAVQAALLWRHLGRVTKRHESGMA